MGLSGLMLVVCVFGLSLVTRVQHEDAQLVEIWLLLGLFIGIRSLK